MLPPLFPDVLPSEAPRRLAILGSTGSIGTQTLEVVQLFPERLRVESLAAGSNWEGLAAQARAVQPATVCIADEQSYQPLADSLAGTGIRVLAGRDGLQEVAGGGDADLVVAAIVGAAGLEPTLAAIRAGRTVALANKETLVVAGALVRRLAADHGATVLPVDSEHSAIFQCLVGEQVAAVEKLVLTASGGPFRTRPADTFHAITAKEALEHPNWAMGAKVTVDSATLMNKGLEVIEARWLFDIEPDRIEVLVHPESLIHSLVVFQDGSSKAQLGVPDMKVPIQYALTYPDRWAAPHERVEWTKLSALHFEPPDIERFPALALAYQALRSGGTAPAVLNAANEVAVDLFLEERLAFTDIPRLIEKTLAQVDGSFDPESISVDDFLEVDRYARQVARASTMVAA